jgi:molecular chaperone GrpE
MKQREPEEERVPRGEGGGQDVGSPPSGGGGGPGTPGPAEAAPGEAPDPGEAPAGAAVEAPSPEELQELTQKARDRDLYRNELLRARADFDNYQKRMQKERQQVADLAQRRLIADLLPVVDNFDRALEQKEADLHSIRAGIRMVRQLLMKVLEDQGLEEIEALERPFDPLVHEAVIHEETAAHPPNTVSEVLQKGYTLRGTVVRPAQVKVARAPESAQGKEEPPPPGPQAEEVQEKSSRGK